MTTYRERTYDEALAEASRRARSGPFQAEAERQIKALTRPDDCSGLRDDPRHQGAHCLCRY
jgi:hypothetical protein